MLQQLLNPRRTAGTRSGPAMATNPEASDLGPVPVTRKRRLRAALTRGLVSCSLAAACSSGESSSPEVVAVALVPNGSTTLTGVVATAVSPVPSVRVVGSDGRPFAGTTVTFSVTGGGQVAASTAVSDASGMASAGGWTLGPTAGSQTLTAAASGLTGVSFTAAATAGGPAAITVVSGDNQQAAVGTPVGPIAVRVDDQYGNPVSGATVTLQVTSGGGQLAMSTALTNAQGVAAAGGWVLGTVPGPNTLTASISGGASRMFTATAIAGAAARLALTGGDAQSGDLGAPLATPLSVRVTDTYGNAVANVAVAFSVTSGSGQLAPVSASTNSQGSASTSLTLTGAGTTTVTASSGAIPGASVVFTASTGPTIVGSIVVAPDASRVQARMRSPAASIARPTRNATAKGGDLPVNESRRWLSEGAALIDTRGRLIVSFHKDAFSLPMDARAYGDASVRSQASAAFYAALQTFETEGLIRRREVSPAIAAVRVDVTPGIDAERVKRLLRQDPRVLDVEEDVVVSAHRVVAARPLFGWSGVPGWEAWTAGWHPAAAPPTELYPSDPLLADQLWHYRMIDLPRVWKVTTGSSAIRVAVVDAGVRPDHPGVAGLLAPSGHYDFTDGTTLAYAFPQPICGTILTFQTVRGTPADVAAPRNVAQAPNDLYLATSPASCWTRSTSGSHGTHVAATIGSPANDGIGGVGVNWNVQIIAVRVLGLTGSGFTFDVAQGILYAGGLPATFTGAGPGVTVQMPPAHVMNVSLGSSSASTVQTNAIAAAAANTLIIASAGNAGSSAPNYPAALPEPISVVALAPDATVASYSTVGTTVDIAAPGGDMSRFWGSAGVASATWNYFTSTPGYSYYQGTSMAAPHVTGVAALVWAANPGLNAAQVRARLLNGALDLYSPGIDNRTGAGLVNAYNAVTGTRGPAANTVVRAIDATTGAVRRAVTASPDGQFTMANLPTGTYHVVAGQSEGPDPTLGVPGRRFGWFGATGMGTVAMNAPSLTNIGVAIGSPMEVEPNDTRPQANPLVVDSWVSGNLMSPDVRDTYVVRIPVAGTYTFETSGVLGACFRGLEVDTVIRLSDVNNVTLADNDDTAFPLASYPGNRCSLVSMSLQPGTYYVEVTPFSGDFGSYRLHVRSGS